MSITAYQKTQNATDTPAQLSIRAVRSIYLYCKDWSDKSLSDHQRLQSIEAGQVLCDTMMLYLNDNLDSEVQEILLKIFTKTSHDLFECTFNPNKSLFENERAMLKILKILQNESDQN